MTGLIVSHQFNARHGADFVAAAHRGGVELDLIVLPPDPEARVADELAARADIAYFSSDIVPQFAKQFFSATRKAPALKWMQVFNAGVDHPVFASVLERGVRLTTASGTAAEPIAQTAIAGMLLLARSFPRWLAGQRNAAMEPDASGGISARSARPDACSSTAWGPSASKSRVSRACSASKSSACAAALSASSTSTKCTRPLNSANCCRAATGS